MELKSKPLQADNAEPSFKCSRCGNMFTADEPQDLCDVCGKTASSKDKSLYASNEDY